MADLYGDALARSYDALNSSVDYASWADFAERCIEKFSDIKVTSVCETACGTGTMACELAKRGYHVTASDISDDMLCAAEMKARCENLDIRFVLQDMRYTKMYSKKDMFLCMLDSMNYLTKKEDIISALTSVYDNLSDGGIFIFDMNSKCKFENIYSDNAYVIEEDGVVCTWQNDYNPKSRICCFSLSFFFEQSDGRYEREYEFQKEKMYTVKQMKSFITTAGFELCGAFGSFDFDEADENIHERIYYVLKKRKK